MLGAAEPRNMISLPGNGVFYFVGQFIPQTLGEQDPLLGVLTMALLLVISAGAAAAVWRTRARLPSA